MGIYQSSPRMCENLKDSKEITDALIDMGVNYFESGDCTLASQLFERAFRVAEETGYELALASVSNNLSILSAVQGYHDRAILHSQDSLARYARLGETYGLAQVYNNLGLVHMEREDWKNALDCFEKSLTLSQKIENLGLAATAYINKADVNAKRADTDAAVHFCGMASSLCRCLGDQRGLAENERIFGVIAALNGELQTAQKHLETSLKMTERYGTFFAVADVHRELGSLYRRRGYRRKALFSLKSALERFEKMGARQRVELVKREMSLLGKLPVPHITL